MLTLSPSVAPRTLGTQAPHSQTLLTREAALSLCPLVAWRAFRGASDRPLDIAR